MIFKLQNDNDIDEESRELWLSCAKDEQNSIIQKVLSIGGSNALEYFNSLVPVMVSEDAVDNIDIIVRRAFWDKFKDGLSKNPPDYLSILPMLEDTKILMKSCIPRRHDIHAEINEAIDIELIKQMIKHNAFDKESIRDIVNYIINKIKQFDSEEYDKKNDDWEKRINEDINNDVPYKEFFPEFFKFVLNRLEIICEQSKIIREEFGHLMDDRIDRE